MGACGIGGNGVSGTSGYGGNAIGYGSGGGGAGRVTIGIGGNGSQGIIIIRYFGIKGNLTVNYSAGGTATGSNDTFTPPFVLPINATPTNSSYYFINWTTTGGVIDYIFNRYATITISNDTSVTATANFGSVGTGTAITAGCLFFAPGCYAVAQSGCSYVTK